MLQYQGSELYDAEYLSTSFTSPFKDERLAIAAQDFGLSCFNAFDYDGDGKDEITALAALPGDSFPVMYDINLNGIFQLTDGLIETLAEKSGSDRIREDTDNMTLRGLG